MTGYLAGLAQVRGTLDRRYEEIRTTEIEPIDGEEAFRQLRQKQKPR